MNASTVDLLLVGAKVFADGSLVDASLGIKDGRIAFVSSREWTPPAKETIDLTGNPSASATMTWSVAIAT